MPRQRAGCGHLLPKGSDAVGLGIAAGGVLGDWNNQKSPGKPGGAACSRKNHFQQLRKKESWRLLVAAQLSLYSHQ